MASSTQIVPKYSFPHVETYVNDYTQVANVDLGTEVNDSVTEAYAITASKGIDNTWVRKTSKADAVATFGDSNFKKYGQPYTQALHVLEHDDSAVWLMRVMPENACYANAVITASYKADGTDIADATKRRFRIKLKSQSLTDVSSLSTFKDKIKDVEASNKNVDGEGYLPKVILSAKYTGRGTCGNNYSLRISQNINYEKNYGITMYNFEILTSNESLNKEANYVAALISSTKYGKQVSTLVDDVLSDAGVGVPPIDLITNEDNIETIYNAYVDFVKATHKDLVTQYASKLKEYNIPEDMLNGTSPVTSEYAQHYTELANISKLITDTEDDKIPALDGFDIMLGNKFGKTTKLPLLTIVKKLTPDVDTTAKTYDSKDYTSEDVIDFGSAYGVQLKNGTNGYFDEPRTTVIDGKSIKYTLQDEIDECYINAFSGNYDKKILSPHRMGITALFDANYSYNVKKALVKLAEFRNSCRLYLDANIIDSLSTESLNALVADYTIFDTHLVSVDIHNFKIREYSTNKKFTVTISYFNAYNFVEHYKNVGYHVPMVNEYAQLSGHVKYTLTPVIEEYDVDVKELLNDNNLNYFECLDEDVFQRATQNTAQISNTDLGEENNSLILIELKKAMENDARSQIYNFADESIRRSFVNFEKAKFQSWVGNQIESFDITFSVSRYEFEQSILHCYLSVVFRGLTKRVIVEIDLNKRTYSDQTSSNDEAIVSL